MKVLTSLLAITLLAVSCSEPPEACLESNKEMAELGEPVTFTNCSLNEDGYQLDFGDGRVENGQDKEVDHSFRKPGSFDVQISVWDEYGEETDKASVMVLVNEPDKQMLEEKWELEKVQTVEGVEIDTSNLDLDELSLGREIIFKEDIIIVGSESHPYTLDSKGNLHIDTELFKIVRLFGGKLVLEKKIEDKVTVTAELHYVSD